MQDSLEKILKKKNILSHKNQGITVCTVENSHVGLNLAKDLMYGIIDNKTVMYLSGGSTPKVLYTRFADDGILQVGAVGVVDERYGKPNHETSNQLMFKQTGLLEYLKIRRIPFYSILNGKSREKTAESYDQKIRELHAVFPKSVAIMGIGTDGHTSGIAPNRKDFKNPIFDLSQKNLLVSEFNDEEGIFKERVTTTFLGLSMFDFMIILVFGEDKKEALELMFSDGKEEEIPARFYTRPEIAQKTLLITDQRV